MWRNFEIRAHFYNTLGPQEKFYAPDLETAMKLARIKWPTADGWECLNPEGMTERKKSSNVADNDRSNAETTDVCDCKELAGRGSYHH